MKTHRQVRQPRRLVADEELYRLRAAGEPLRMIAERYGVSHTTLSRHFAHPQAKAKLREAAEVIRAQERAEREARRLAVRQAIEERKARRQFRRQPPGAAVADRATGAPPAGTAKTAPAPVPRRRYSDPYMAWLDEHDNRRHATRADLWKPVDTKADKAVAAGGGMEAVIAATGLRTEANVERQIDPATLERARANDAAFQRPEPSVPGSASRDL